MELSVTQNSVQKNPSGSRLRAGILFFFLCVLGSWQAPLLWANVLGNGDFEGAIGSGTASNWDSTNGVTRVTTATLPAGGFTAVPQGTFAIEISNLTDFTFQTFDHVKPGDFVTFSALVESSVLPGGGAQGGRLVIEFKSVFEESGGDVLISSTGSAFITTANAPAGGGYVRISVSGFAPAGTERVVFVINSNGGAAGNIVADSANGEVNPAKLNVFPSKSNVERGEPFVVHAQFKNFTADTLTNLRINSTVPAGFVADLDSVRVNGREANALEGSLIVNVGNIAPNQTVDVGFVMVAGAATIVGKTYQFDVKVNNPTGQISEAAITRVRVTADPLFDEGTIIGKVFNDLNRDGLQDKGEAGVPHVRLVTEEGIVVVTDAHGRYHIPAVKQGRHLVKIDGHTLPEGTEFITEETYLIRTTAGIMSKANFAVVLPPSEIPEEFQEDLSVQVTQGLNLSRPNLEVIMQPEMLALGVGVLEEEPVFRFKTNYRNFIKRWFLEIRDPMGREVWTGFGVGAPPAEVTWSGIAEDGLMIKPGIYSYQLKVEDPKGRQDWTTLKFLQVASKQDLIEEKAVPIEIPTVGDFNLFQDGKQSIPLIAKPTIRVQGQTKPFNTVHVNGYPVDVDGISGDFQTEIYTLPGETEIQVTTTTPEGETTSYSKKVTVKDSMFFMVGLGEQELGHNFTSGNLETVGQDAEFKDGFYQDGRLSYYLVGKLKGKFLIKSHYDTSDKRSAGLFTNLDPEKYYPVYGDGSQRNYEAQDTQSRLFFVVEMDRSFIQWGSFETNFNDTELATYNRTMSGMNAHFETVATTPYGDPKQQLKIFSSNAPHRADHNEFLGTGGTLYYVRNRNVLEGSEKLRVEVRDKVQNMAIGSYDLKEGKDYEIDYDEGRILLTRPLSSVAASEVAFSDSILDGSEVYLVADYEFDAGQSAAAVTNRGIRGYTHMGDHVKIGATAIEEQREQDYDMRAVDATWKIGRNSKIIAEYATTKLQQTGQALSFNGGLTFSDQPFIKTPRLEERENAFLVKAQSQPVKNLELSGYVQGVEPGFSTDRIRSQEALKKHGVSALYRFTPRAFVRYRYDHQEVSDSLMPLNQNGIFAPFNSVQSQIVQAAYDSGTWFTQAEYLQRAVDLPEANLIPSLLSEVPFEHAVAAKLGYQVNERLRPYVKAQTTLNQKANHQFGGGLRYEITHNISAYLEQMFGTIGDSTYFGFEEQVGNGGRKYASLRMIDRGIGLPVLTTAIGSSTPLSSRSRVFSQREHSTYQGEDRYADVLGFETKPNSQWAYEVRFERQHLDNANSRLLDQTAQSALNRSNTSNAVFGSVGYEAPVGKNGQKIQIRTTMEGRREQDAPKMWQTVTRNNVDYIVSPDLTFRTVFNWGLSRFRDPEGRPADFMEMNTGFAYRPVENDWFNVLGRYTYLRDIANDAQFESGLFTGGADIDEIAHIFSLDVAYEVFRHLGMVDKVADKSASIRSAITDNVTLNSFLWAHRFNFHVTRKWDVAVEYRALWQSNLAKALRHGALFEVDREVYDYVRIGAGYDFTDFDDNLRSSNSFKSHGPFVRLTGKF